MSKTNPPVNTTQNWSSHPALPWGFYPVGFHDSVLHNHISKSWKLLVFIHQMADAIVILDLNVAGQIITCRLLVLIGWIKKG